MSLPVEMRREASRDVEEARDHLDDAQAGLGQRFLDRLNETLGRIGHTPEMYGLVWQDVRAAPMRKFRYVVYYRVHGDRVEVMAVIHGSRDASVWQERA